MIYLQAIHAVLTPERCGQYTVRYLHGKINVDHTSSLSRVVRLGRIDVGGFPSAPSLRPWLSSILRLCAVRGAIAEVLRLHLPMMTTTIDASVGPAACVHGDHSRISFAGRVSSNSCQLRVLGDVGAAEEAKLSSSSGVGGLLFRSATVPS